MKAKKLKLLLKQINSIAQRDISEIKGFKVTQMELSPGHPLVLLPTQGKYCLPEVKIISKLIMAIEPTDIVEEARKINAQTGILLVSAIPNPVNKNVIIVLVHTPYGCCAYDAFITEDSPKPNLKEVEGIPVEIELPDELKKKYVVM